MTTPRGGASLRCLPADERKGEQVPDTAVAATYVDAENQILSASNGVDYAYRATGDADAARS